MALLRVGDILIQRHTDALGDSALGLNSRQIRIDNGSAVNNGRVIDQLHLAGLRIHLHLGHSHHKWRR